MASSAKRTSSSDRNGWLWGFTPQAERWIRRTLLVSLLISLIWLPGISLSPALAVPVVATAMPERIASKTVDSAAEGDRTTALIACLPKQLSQPNLKRALGEMSNDQIERAFNLKASPGLSQAEAELKNCLNRKGFTSY